MTKNLKKPNLNDVDNFGIKFKIEKIEEQYRIRCVCIYNSKDYYITCIRNIPTEEHAKDILKFIEKYWDKNKKIYRVFNYSIKKNMAITPYCEIHKSEEFKTQFEEFMQNKVDKEFEEMEQIIKKSNKLIREIERSLEELSK